MPGLAKLGYSMSSSVMAMKRSNSTEAEKLFILPVREKRNRGTSTSKIKRENTPNRSFQDVTDWSPRGPEPISRGDPSGTQGATKSCWTRPARRLRIGCSSRIPLFSRRAGLVTAEQPYGDPSMPEAILEMVSGQIGRNFRFHLL